MNRSLIICDRFIYGSLLAMVFFLPYSLAVIAICQGTMFGAWVCKRSLLSRMPGSQACARGFNLFHSSMGWSLIALALLIALTIPFSHYPALSTKKFFTRFLQQIFLMYLITETVHTRKRLCGFLVVLFSMLFFVTVDGMFQVATGTSFIYHTALSFGRLSGPMKHPNDLGTLIVSVLPLVLVCFITCRTCIPWASKGMMAALFLMLIISLGLTSSRGAWFSFAISMLVLGFSLKYKRLMLFIVLMLMIFSWIFGIRCLSTRIDMYSESMTHGPVMSPSWSNPLGLPSKYKPLDLFLGPSGRELYWETALEVIKKYPWYGCGYSAYVRTLEELHYARTEYPHNSLLHIAAELGIAGLLLYLWFFFTFCRQSWKLMRELAVKKDLYVLGCGLLSGILGWLIHSLLDTPWSSLQLSILLWLMIGVLFSLGFIKDEEVKTCL